MSSTLPTVDPDRPSPTAAAPIGSTAIETMLASAQPGHFICLGIDDQSINPARMNSLGVCVGRSLELVSTGDPMIIRVGGSAVGLSRQLAAAVTVAQLPNSVTK